MILCTKREHWEVHTERHREIESRQTDFVRACASEKTRVVAVSGRAVS